ncbi:unnamed protein product [Anisakis simplex]|uniref:Aa_trans domain-containing protein n=1 Tax=Anisakis simplex TaxID=6269 RepID=A0A0M3KBL9_ANISI|nr:unnamed protein product [Anisakis simplex]
MPSGKYEVSEETEALQAKPPPDTRLHVGFSCRSSFTLDPSLFSISGGYTGALLLAIFAATIGGSFQFGYHIGCINVPQQVIKEWYVDSHEHLFGNRPTIESIAKVQWSVLLVSHLTISKNSILSAKFFFTNDNLCPKPLEFPLSFL